MTNKAKCPECGEAGLCNYLGDAGGASCFDDEYSFECLNPGCGHKEKKSIYGGSYEDGHGTECPFCGESCFLHK